MDVAHSSSLNLSPNIEFWPLLLSHLLTKLLPNSKILLIYGNFFLEDSHPASRVWQRRLDDIASQAKVISLSGGVTSLEISRNYTNFQRISRTKKTLSDVIQAVILLLPLGIPSKDEEAVVFQRLNLPLLDPLTIRNADKYFIITDTSQLGSLYKCDVIRKIKYKTFLTPEENDDIKLRQYCSHCPIPEKVFTFPLNRLILDAHDFGGTMELSSISEYFPDFQRNYHGYILRVSSTDKMGGDLEFATNANGEVYAKRGVFASAMYHLAEGLNFTAQLYRSTAGASTGHTLSNGTWVGSVGDVYNGDAAFCMLCGMSYNRHFIVEICSPVTYEYIRFAIGPSEKLYTWQAIFWPFDGSLWFALLATTFMAIFFSYLFLKFQENLSGWSILSVSQYFGRIFIEQSQDLPHGLPESIKIILGFWLLFVLVGTTIYRAKMVTFMTFPVFEKAPETYDELIRSPYEIDFHYFPNIAYNSFKTSTNPVIMSVFQKMLKQPDPIKCLQHTLETKSVCIMFTSVHEDTVSRNVSDRFGQSPIRSSTQYAFMFTPGISSQKRADFTPNFRSILQTSLQMGLNDWWVRSDAYGLLKGKNTWIKSLPPTGNNTGVFQYDPGDSDDVLHLKHFKGAFTVLIGGWVFAFGTFVTEQGGKAWNRIANKHGRLRRKWKKQATLLSFLNNNNMVGP